MDDKGHLSKASNFASTTLSGNLNLHISLKHDTATRSEEKFTKIMGFLKKYRSETSCRATYVYEGNRDFVSDYVMICLHLILLARKVFRASLNRTLQVCIY